MPDDPAANPDPGTSPADQAPGEPNPAPSDPPANDPPPADDWRSGIEDEKLRQFADRFTSPIEAAKTAFEFRQKLSNAITLPGKNATEDDIKDFRKKLGVPDTPEGYKYKLPDDAGDDLKEDITGLVSKLHAAGATPATVNAAVEARLDAIKAGQESMAKRVADSIAATEAQLKKEWGADYEKNITFATRAGKQFGSDEFKEFLDTEVDGKRLGDHPLFLKVFANIGRKMGEGGLHQALSDDEKATAEQKMSELTSKAHDARDRGNTSEARRLFAERDKLAKEFYGSESA